LKRYFRGSIIQETGFEKCYGAIFENRAVVGGSAVKSGRGLPRAKTLPRLMGAF
jgi:hypothetical protein